MSDKLFQDSVTQGQEPLLPKRRENLVSDYYLRIGSRALNGPWRRGTSGLRYGIRKCRRVGSVRYFATPSLTTVSGDIPGVCLERVTLWIKTNVNIRIRIIYPYCPLIIAFGE